MAKAPAPDLLVVTTAFACVLGGQELVFRAGELASADHPAVRKYRDHFGPVLIHHASKIESATAAPGEKRGA